MWKINTEKSADHWLEIEDEDGWYEAIAKWDGCVHFTKYSNEPKSEKPENQDYLHICDLAGEIERLYELLQIARAKFGPEYYREPKIAP